MLNRCPGNPSHGSHTFTCISADQSFVVPFAVWSVRILAWGAAGGGGYYAPFATKGGDCGYIEGTLSVTPGETLTIITGAGGAAGIASGCTPGVTYNQAYGGGGGCVASNFGSVGGGGGGRTAIRRGLVELFTAGAGGGAGVGGSAIGTSNGGWGGGLTGGAGLGINPGQGGTQTAGGYGVPPSTPGGLFYGGLASGYDVGAGDGGSGFYGGGGGDLANNTNSGGGGGSGQTGVLTGSTITSGASGVPNTSSPYYIAGVGAGAFDAVGGNGLLVIIW